MFPNQLSLDCQHLLFIPTAYSIVSFLFSLSTSIAILHVDNTASFLIPFALVNTVLLALIQLVYFLAGESAGGHYG
jgi:hypothetical protein